MPKRIYGLVCALVAASAIAVVTAPLGSAASRAPRYYIALGDSLSQGVQPNVTGDSLETNEGYADQLFATLQKRIPSLQLVKLGCPGDTTTSMLTGHGNSANARKAACVRTGGSQLAAVERFLKAHHKTGEVALITVDIGANDVDGCAAPGVNLSACLTAGEASIKTNVPKILSALHKAAAPGTALAAMTLYDPVLSNYFSAVPATQALGEASAVLAKQVNALLINAYTATGFKTADVAGAFSTYDSADTVQFNGKAIPLNVARVCSWTWACTTPPSGPNIHANKNGYAVIAGAFAKVIGHLH